MNIEKVVEDLNKVNLNIAKLNVHKRNLENLILKHYKRAVFSENDEVISIPHEGRTTEKLGRFKVVIKTENIYTLNKQKYAECRHLLDSDCNPVLEKTVYEVNKKLYKMFDLTSSLSDEIRGQLISFRPGKPSVTLEANT